MLDRYRATFDSLRPELGVVVDAQQERYCTFPSLKRAQRAADRWNQEPLWGFDPPMLWRSTITGKELRNESTNSDSGALAEGDS